MLLGKLVLEHYTSKVYVDIETSDSSKASDFFGYKLSEKKLMINQKNVVKRPPKARDLGMTIKNQRR